MSEDVNPLRGGLTLGGPLVLTSHHMSLFLSTLKHIALIVFFYIGVYDVTKKALNGRNMLNYMKTSKKDLRYDSRDNWTPTTNLDFRKLTL